MKLIILKNNLLECLSAVERAIGENTNLPILKNILFKTDENKIILTATNLEIAVSSSVPGKIVENGTTTVPFGILNNIIKNLVSERVTLEQKNNQLAVNTDNYEALIQTQAAKDFPIIPSIRNKEKSIESTVSVFRESLASVLPATQFSEIRPEISGVFIFLKDGELTFVATDSFRLAEKKINLNKIKIGSEPISAIIPLKTANEFLRIFKKEEAVLSVFVDPNQILFKTEEIEIISHLVDGRFPDYQAIIPKQVSTEVFVSREELIGATKLTSSFSGKISDLTLKTGENKKLIEAYSASNSLGENRYMVPAKIKGDKFSIVFNWRYLLDGLKIYKNQEIVLGVNASDKPATIKSLTESDLVYVLMPIRS